MTNDKIETREFEIRTADEEHREIRGIAVPWDTPTMIGGWYEEQFERGSVDDDGALLFWRHDEPIGRLTAGTDTDEGREIRAVVSKTPRGDEAMTLLRDGVISKLSVGFESIEHRVDEESNLVTRTKVRVREVSLVPIPAYEGATITEVREDREPKEIMTNISVTEPADLTEVRESIEDLERRMATLSISEGTPVADTRSAGEVLQAIVAGDEATIRQYNDLQARAYAGGTSGDAPVKDGWVGDLTRIFDSSTGVLSNIFETGALPATGLNIEYGELATNTVQVTEQENEGDDLAFGKVTLTTKTAPVHTYGGYTQLTRQAIERSTLPLLNRSLEALAVAAGARKKAVLRAAYGALLTARKAIATNGGVVVLGATLANATAEHWTNAIIDAAIRYDAENAGIEALLVSPTVFKRLNALQGGTLSVEVEDGNATVVSSGGRAFQVASGDQVGTLNLPGLRGSLAGITVIADPGQAGDEAAFVNGKAIRQYDSALVSLQDENIINLSKDFSVYRYGAVAAEIPQLVVPVKLAAS